QRARASSQGDLIAQDLGGGDVEVTAVATERFFTPPDREYRGRRVFLADLGGGDYLVVGRPVERTARSETIFPCKRFELVRLPGARTLLLIEPVADPIEPRPFPRDLGPLEENAVIKLEVVP
ncbi:MAG: hypothetical protein ACAI25_12290, partial [Planctomycetota bacterium]